MTDNPSAPLSPLSYLSWVRRHWLLTGLFLMVGTAVAGWYTLQLPGLFQSTVYVKFQREAADAGMFDQLTSLALTATPDQQLLQIDPVKHDLALAEFADGHEFNQKLVAHIQQNYPALLDRYATEIRRYSDNPETALDYFVRYHFRVYRLKHDGFFI
ncbi:hypothetical protein C9928_06760, partial [Pseudidiomarina aestuarii]